VENYNEISLIRYCKTLIYHVFINNIFEISKNSIFGIGAD